MIETCRRHKNLREDMVEGEIRLLLLPSISTTSGGAEEELTAEMVVVRLCLEVKLVLRLLTR